MERPPLQFSLWLQQVRWQDLILDLVQLQERPQQQHCGSQLQQPLQQPLQLP